MTKHIALGVDIGGSGIKAAPVDIRTGTLIADRFRIPTPDPATPQAVARTVARCLAEFSPSAKTAIGVAFPGVIQHGVVKTAANVDDSWIDTDLRQIIREYAGHDVHVMNDADAAGFGEHHFGAAHGRNGVVLMTTLGTGIGTALIVDGQLVPNTEFGHLIIDGDEAEHFAADSARERLSLDWEAWSANLQRFYSEMERLVWPDLIIVGGGVSKSHDRFLPQLDLRAPIIPAELLNGAGIVGAAAWAHEESRRVSGDAAAGSARSTATKSAAKKGKKKNGKKAKRP